MRPWHWARDQPQRGHMQVALWSSSVGDKISPPGSSAPLQKAVLSFGRGCSFRALSNSRACLLLFHLCCRGRTSEEFRRCFWHRTTVCLRSALNFGQFRAMCALPASGIHTAAAFLTSCPRTTLAEDFFAPLSGFCIAVVSAVDYASLCALPGCDGIDWTL